MTYYGGRELAAAFRTVRNNTIQIAEEIGEEHYGFRAAPGTRSVAETLLHIANVPRIAYQIHGVTKVTTFVGFDFMGVVMPLINEEKNPHTKAEILKKLTEGREQFASFLEGLSEDFLTQEVAMPPNSGNPPSKTRFEMLLSTKEHEMHHRGQLMLLERMVGIVPHLTRQMEARMAQMQQSAAR